jgi:short-subunit dehydrogenase
MTRHIVITGASSGLGRALALEYAAPGVMLGLIGRDEARLAEVAARARANGATVEVARLDTRDQEALRLFLVAFDDANPIDLLLASAGVTMVTPSPGEVEDISKAQELFDINLNGTMNTIGPIAPRMRARRSGQIALFSSLAAFAPPPDSPSYAASKAALLAFGLATRALYLVDDVNVSVVCPGFVDTPMTGSFASVKPFLISAEDAARRIRRGLEHTRPVIAFPFLLYLGARFQQFLPYWLQARIMLTHRATAQSSRS